MLPLVVLGGLVAILLLASSKSTAHPGGASALPPGPTQGGVRPLGQPAIAPGGGGGGGFGALNIPSGGTTLSHHPFLGLVQIPSAPPVNPTPFINPHPPLTQPTSTTATVTTQQTGTAGELLIRSSPQVIGTINDWGNNIVGFFNHGDIAVLTGPLQNGWYPVLNSQTGAAGYSSAQFLRPN